MSALIEVSGLTCERGERTLFEGLSFSVEAGTLVRIAGSNGAGKTTLLRLMTGLMRPVEGEVRWRGTPVQKAAQDFWKELCYIGHRNGVKDDLSVLENVLLNARIASLSVTEEEALDALDAGFNGQSFTDIKQYLVNPQYAHGIADPYMCLADFDSYLNTHDAMTRDYQNRDKWNRMSLINIAKSGYFSADRAIREYADNIWHLRAIK